MCLWLTGEVTIKVHLCKVTFRGYNNLSSNKNNGLFLRKAIMSLNEPEWGIAYASIPDGCMYLLISGVATRDAYCY